MFRGAFVTPIPSQETAEPETPMEEEKEDDSHMDDVEYTKPPKPSTTYRLDAQGSVSALAALKNEHYEVDWLITATSNLEIGPPPQAVLKQAAVAPMQGSHSGLGVNVLSSHCANEYEGKRTSSIEHIGDVTCMKLLDDGTAHAHIVTGSSMGGIALYSMDVRTGELAFDARQGRGLHTERLTGVDVVGNDTAVVVCEGGMVSVINLDRMTDNVGGNVFRSEPPRDLPYTAVAFQGGKSDVFVTAGSSRNSQLQVWDKRIKPAKVAAFGQPDRCVYTCLVNKSSTPDIFVAGTSTGHVVWWDIRVSTDVHANRSTVNHKLLKRNVLDKDSAHCEVRGVACHPTHKDLYYSAALDGQFRAWASKDDRPDAAKYIPLKTLSSGVVALAMNNAGDCFAATRFGEWIVG